MWSRGTDILADFDARRALDALSDAVVAADANQRILFANRHVKKLLGWKPEELIGRVLAELIPPPHQVMDLGQPILVRAMRSDGMLREVELTLNSSEGDETELLVATLRESRAYIEPENSATKLRAILETISIGVLLAEGPEGRLTISNPAATRIAGEPITASSYEEFVRKFPLEKLDGPAMEFGERPLARTMELGEPVSETLRFRRRDGREFILEVTTAPFPGPEGGAVTTFADVTARYQLEQDSADRATQFRALIDHLPVGVAYFDKMGVCRAGNAPARRFLGRTRSEIAGAPADELFVHTPELLQAIRECVSEQTSHSIERVPWPDASRPGSIRYLDWQFEPLSPDPAKPRGALSLIVDVTDRAHAEAERLRAMEASESASRRKTQFLSAVSHDLRTPVNALSLQAELLSRIVEMRDDPGEELQLLAGDIRSVAGNLIELINDLLDLTRFDSGVVDHHPTTFRLDDWLATTLAPLELTARTKNLEFSWSVDRPDRVVCADRVKLGRVLVNLVGNAVKFTEEGGVSISAGADENGALRLAVTDTGPGIPADQLERIFDEFAQLRNPERDRTKGTGLGLAICRRLVEGVGGHLTVKSQQGRGSTFAAIYPADHLITMPDLDLPATEPEGPPTPRPATPITILIIDDDTASAHVMTRLLHHAGYTVSTADTGTAALEILSRMTPDLILLDLLLPGMSGTEVLRRIRQNPELKSLKVVVVTGDIEAARRGELATLNVDGLLAKPVDFNSVLALLTRMAPLGPPAED
ncbi:MAG: domain S-box protein [Planctomycetota bacterium]|nr:domain S-box protein [Planctomycetota bacterium]